MSPMAAYLFELRRDEAACVAAGLWLPASFCRLGVRRQAAYLIGRGC